MLSIYNRYNFDILLDGVFEQEISPAPEFVKVPNKADLLAAIKSHGDLPPNLFGAASSDVDFSKTDWMGIQTYVESLAVDVSTPGSGLEPTE